MARISHEYKPLLKAPRDDVTSSTRVAEASVDCLFFLFLSSFWQKDVENLFEIVRATDCRRRVRHILHRNTCVMHLTIAKTKG